jgi:hypothetical protein
MSGSIEAGARRIPEGAAFTIRNAGTRHGSSAVLAYNELLSIA